MDQTLGRFASYGDAAESPSSWGTALLSSSTIYTAVAIAALILGSAAHKAVTEKTIDLTFTERIAKPEPPPPPIEVKAAPPPAAAPVVLKNMKVRQLDKPAPPKEMVAPKELPKEAPREADPSQDKGIAVFGEPGDGDPAGLEGGTRGGVAGGHVGAIALPEDADPPMPLKTNTVPSYPQEAKATGKSDTVILKVIVQADGRVADVQELRGDEPFVGAAVTAVKSWRYEPARYKGQPITVYRIIQIPFKLNA